jgi:hypothetical protein
MEKEMRELYIEGVAIRGGPESCVGVREGAGEALTGVVRAGLLSREMLGSGVPTPSNQAEGNIAGGVIASRRGTPRGQRTWARIEISMRENREVPRSPDLGVEGSGREGKAEAVIP